MPSKESGQVDNATQGYNLMKHKAKYLIFSALVILPGAFFLGFWGLKVSIDFTGGSVFSYTRAEGVWNRAEVQDVLEKAGVEIIAVALEAGDKNFTVRTKSIGCETITKFIKQQTRWRRSGVRESLFLLSFSKNIYLLVLIFSRLILPLIFTILFMTSIIYALLSGHFYYRGL